MRHVYRLSLIESTLLVIIAIGLLFLAYTFNPLRQGVFFPVVTCTVGVVGTAANVTFTGDNAQAECDSYTRAHRSMYSLDSPQGDELCAGTIDGQKYAVRDTGLFHIEGLTLCRDFTAWGSSHP